MSQKAERIKVAIVDSMGGYLESISALLEYEGLDVVSFLSTLENHAQLLEQIIVEKPDVVLTGVRNINDMDGYDLSGISLALALKNSGIPTVINSTLQYSEGAAFHDLPFVEKASGYEEKVKIIKSVVQANRMNSDRKSAD